MSEKPQTNPLIPNITAPQNEIWGRWSNPDPNGWKVRGPAYLEDKKKMPAGPYVMQLAHVELRGTNKPLSHVAARNDSFVNRFMAEKKQQGITTPNEFHHRQFPSAWQSGSQLGHLLHH